MPGRQITNTVICSTPPCTPVSYTPNPSLLSLHEYCPVLKLHGGHESGYLDLPWRQKTAKYEGLLALFPWSQNHKKQHTSITHRPFRGTDLSAAILSSSTLHGVEDTAHTRTHTTTRTITHKPSKPMRDLCHFIRTHEMKRLYKVAKVSMNYISNISTILYYDGLFDFIFCPEKLRNILLRNHGSSDSGRFCRDGPTSP